MPEVITLVPNAFFNALVVVEVLRGFPQFDGVARFVRTSMLFWHAIDD